MASWKEDIVQALINLGGESHYEPLYAEIKKIRGEDNLSKSWKEITRRNIQYHSSDSSVYKGKENLFYTVEGIGSGTWGLRNFLSDKEIARDEDRGFPEGKAKYREHLFRERNSTVIKKAKCQFKKDNGTLYCEVCGFDFEKTYGEIGSDFIEAHHTIPISEMSTDSETRIKDLIMVCSNCHRMLHRKRPWVTKAALKSLLI